MGASNSVRQLAVAVLRQSIEDLRADSPRLCAEAEQFFVEDFRIWAWLAGIAPDVVARMLPRPDAPRCPARAAANGTCLPPSARPVASRTRSSEADDTASPTTDGGGGAKGPSPELMEAGGTKTRRPLVTGLKSGGGRIMSKPRKATATRAELAALLGVTPCRVTKYVEAGLPCVNHGRGKPTTFDVGACVQWLLGRRAATPPPDITAARARRMAALARLAEHEASLREGRVVDSAVARKDAFECHRIVRDAILSVPSRIGAQLAAESDATKVHVLLDGELRLALTAAAEKLIQVGDSLDRPGKDKRK